MRGGSAFGSTLYQGLSPQGCFWRSTWIMHLIVWGGNHFSLWRVLEHLVDQSSVASLLLSNQIILWRGGVCLRDRHSAVSPNWTPILFSIGRWSSLRCLVWVKCVVFLDDLTMLPSKARRRRFTAIWWFDYRGSEQLAWRSMGANMNYATRQCVQYSLSW